MQRLRRSFALSAAAASLLAAPALASPAGEVTMAPAWGPPTSSLLARVAAGQVGGVILMGRAWSSSTLVSDATARLQAVACRRGEPLLIGTDQEGGSVRRFAWAPPNASAATQGTAAEVRAQAAATASALRRAGIGIDFAPVADTAATPASFLHSRAFGRDPAVVAQLASSFVAGLQEGGVAATAKHFPGLGSATVSTDDRPVTIGRSAAFLRARLAPFKAAIAAGTKLVMISNASYPALDPAGAPAVFSRPIVTDLLRDELGFGGVVISDALDTPTPAHTPHAPSRAIDAGVDVLLYTTTPASQRAYASLVADARASASLRAELAASGVRIRALKAWLAANGGPSCP
jgi:beta-N-acetylhexosaminidase